MNVHVYFHPGEADPTVLQDATVVVIDVVRATTSMVEALANGARAIYPTASTEEAVKLASSLGRDDTLLCGERKGIKVEGFDLGNSPPEFSRKVVKDKRLVMSTTNGTVAFTRTQEAERVVACAFTNLSAVADAVRATSDLVVLCAGRLGRFSLDDALCAGHLLHRIGVEPGEATDLNDAAHAVLALARQLEPSPAFLSTTSAGKALKAIDLADDLDVCGAVDRHAIAPEMRDQGLIVVEG